MIGVVMMNKQELRSLGKIEFVKPTTEITICENFKVRTITKPNKLHKFMYKLLLGWEVKDIDE
jgi:hypothetical protein